MLNNSRHISNLLLALCVSCAACNSHAADLIPTDVQAKRDETRLTILQAEMASEVALLQQIQAAPTTPKQKDSVTLHQKNIAALQQEIDKTVKTVRSPAKLVATVQKPSQMKLKGESEAETKSTHKKEVFAQEEKKPDYLVF